MCPAILTPPATLRYVFNSSVHNLNTERPVERADAVRQALDVARPTLEEMAELAGVSASTLSKWRTGATRPTDQSMRRFREALRHQARRTEKVASQIDAILDETEGTQ